MINVNFKILTGNALAWLARPAFIITLLLLPLVVQAQNFTLVVNPTNATCLGNGGLSFTILGGTGAPVNYKVYLLPNTTTTIYNGPNTSIPGLAAGNYLVRATQGTAIDETQATINNLVVPLNYTLQGDNAFCGNDGSITVNITTGNPVSYEISEGPVTVAPQASNVFTNLPAGFYTINVTDDCGSVIVKQFNLGTDSPELSVSAGVFLDVQLPGCNLITATNVITPVDINDPIIFPLTATYTVYPPNGGAPIQYTQNIPSGDSLTVEVSQVIPFYYDDTPYNYTLVVTDQCGNPFSQNTNPVSAELTAAASFGDDGCGNFFFLITPNKYVGPYTINFIDVPAGFNPVNFNSNYPGPYTIDEVPFGSPTNPVPFDNYSFTVTDACGRTSVVTEALLEEPELEPSAAASNSDCIDGLGQVVIIIPGRTIAIATISAGPPGYPIPTDASPFVTQNDGLVMGGLTPGDYVFELTDTCGNEYDPIPVTIPDYTPANLSIVSRPDCTPGLATLSIGHNTPIESVIMTAAPLPFDQTLLPYNVSFNIIDGDFFMDGLPPGNYVFDVVATCQTFDDQTVNNIAGYTVTSSNVTHTAYCGSFGLIVEHEANSISGQRFWLQKLIDPIDGIWGHPQTGVVFANNGTAPTTNNSVELQNNVPMQYFFYSTGRYRVIKSYNSFGNGVTGRAKNCIETLHEFDFYDTLTIIDAQNLTCSGVIADVLINAEGTDPLIYEIITKNGDPFIINNGNNNIFTGLDFAIYEVKVSDPCANELILLFNVAELPTLVSAAPAPDLNLCDPDGNGTENFDLTLRESDILNGQSTDDVTVTYYATQSDAALATNPLSTTYTSTSATIYVRVQYNNDASCFALNSFNIVVNPVPVLQMPGIVRGCADEDITISADAGFQGYEWSNGELTQQITVTEPGEYIVTVTDFYGCTTDKTVLVVTYSLPVISSIEVTDWTDNNNTITVIMEQGEGSVDSFEYSLDGITYQESNVFNDLEPGIYNVFVKDTYGCNDTQGAATLLTYPKFFTPNGDGQNDRWRIQFSTTQEPGLNVLIYDRYGKLVTGFTASSTGWDGTLNGTPLPSTDYWFVVQRQDGIILKGHFALIR